MFRLRGQIPIEQTDNASLALFRIIFGLIGFVSAIRFLANGWVETCFETPTYFFSYSGFEFVRVLSADAMTALFIVMAISALGIALGWFYRVSTVLFFLTFTYVELIDVTNYLNHYYLISLLAFLFCWLPLHRRFSIDAWRNRELASVTAPVWVLYLLRVQVAVVYFYAGVAKVSADWLLHAQPLSIWLRARVDTPLIGGLFEHREVAYAMSWLGCLFDLTIVGWLLWPKSRRIAYVALVGFHTTTGLLFNIGMFPFIMIGCATIFFAADWPARKPTASESKTTVAAWTLVLALIWCSFQILFPLRTFLYDGDVLWHEQGMRWSWRVMVREKTGAISYRVVNHDTEKTSVHSPRQLLTRHQEREMSGQPDLIARLGKEIGRRHGANVSVYADALVSLNGRAPAPIIDPTFDLMTFDDGISNAKWILDAPRTDPR